MADGVLRLRGLHDSNQHKFASPPTAPIPHHEQDASRLMQLPSEVQLHILRFCDYCDLRKLLRTCRRMKAFIEASPRCCRALHRPSVPPLTRDEMIPIRTKVLHSFATRSIPAEQDGGEKNFAYSSARPDYNSFVCIHPAIEDASWSTEDEWDDVKLRVGTYVTREFKIAQLALRREAATDPPVQGAQIGFRSARHRRTCRTRVDKRDGEGPLTVEDVLTAAIKLTQAWVVSFYDGDAQDDLFANRVWAQGPFVRILESGYVTLTVEVIND
ncbi:hypothetical protein OC846_004703 [Tilletia horrida]|uniref:F-box domain-containing protein n=1 Tax=Tilletia horrida TaxID=155126 RepID=A0AAN6GMN0_9BASI|nr:hypothetical protein OC846_004703 [Tilletia horrida]